METHTVAEALHGSLLQDFLYCIWPDVSRSLIRQALETEAVTVNGLIAHGRLRVRNGDQVAVDLDLSAASHGPSPAAKAAKLAESLAVLAESGDFLVVDKPAGIPSIPDRAGKYDGVQGLLTAQRPSDDLRIVHRLDQDTSGCLILAKGLAAAQALTENFAAGQVQKEYLALVEGRLAKNSMVIERSLGPDPRRPGRIMVVAAGSKKARSAVTMVEVEERFRGYSLLRLRPKTGRSHQLRVHLRSIGHPIVCDQVYGGRPELLLSAFKSGYKIRKGVRERPLLQRMFLHACRLEFEDPAGGGLIKVASELPADLSQVLKKMRRFASLEGQLGSRTESS